MADTVDEGAAPGLEARVAARASRLSPNDRRIAEHVLGDLAGASYASAEELAARIGVSKAALVRFGTRVGLGGFAGLQRALATEVRALLDRRPPGEAPRAGLIDDWQAAIASGLTATAAANASAIESAAAMLDSGEGWIHVFGQRASAAVADYAYFLLNPVLPNVVRVEAGESALADHLLDVGPEDRLLAITFRRYARLTTEVVDYFAEAGAATVVLTDSAAAPAAEHASAVLVCADASPAPFASAVPGVFLIEVLVAALLARDPARADRRRGDAERVWGRFGPY